MFGPLSMDSCGQLIDNTFSKLIVINFSFNGHFQLLFPKKVFGPNDFRPKCQLFLDILFYQYKFSFFLRHMTAFVKHNVFSFFLRQLTAFVKHNVLSQGAQRVLLVYGLSLLTLDFLVKW